MKFSFLIFLIFLLSNCRTMKLSNNRNDLLRVNLDGLNHLSEFDLQTVEMLAIELSAAKTLPPESIDLSADINTMEDEIHILNKLAVLKKCKKLKVLYFMNIHLSKIPVEVTTLKYLEFLQFNFYRFFDPIAESKKLAKFKNLKTLSINTFYLPKEKGIQLKIELDKLKKGNIVFE